MPYDPPQAGITRSEVACRDHSGWRGSVRDGVHVAGGGCPVKLLPIPKSTAARFYGFEEFGSWKRRSRTAKRRISLRCRVGKRDFAAVRSWRSNGRTLSAGVDHVWRESNP